MQLRCGEVAPALTQSCFMQLKSMIGIMIMLWLQDVPFSH
jgi:hypothetical protein